MAEAYARSLLNPFDSTFPQPKILDGSIDRSSGLRFRSSGNVTLSATGGDNWFVILPGFARAIHWRVAAGAFISSSLFPTHVGTPTDRLDMRRIRLVSTAAKFSLLNTSDDNEGYWEAVRIPVEQLIMADVVAPVGEDYTCRPADNFALTDLANYPTYQTGRLRDLHRFMFKLNSVQVDHPFKEIVAVPVLKDLYDEGFDAVVIRIVGRIDAVTPSMIMYETVSNQEVLYREGSIMARLAINNVMVPNMNVILDSTRFAAPAVQIA